MDLPESTYAIVEGLRQLQSDANTKEAEELFKQLANEAEDALMAYEASMVKKIQQSLEGQSTDDQE